MGIKEDITSPCEILRPVIHNEQIAFRGENLSPDQRVRIRKALQTLHNFEIMAVNLYRFQIRGRRDPLDRELIAAMCNEQTHVQDFLVRLYEYGFRPSVFRGFWWLVGLMLGFGSRMLGQRRILETGIWAESKAVEHYTQLIQSAPWDPPTRGILEKNQSDETGHIRTWKQFLEAN